MISTDPTSGWNLTQTTETSYYVPPITSLLQPPVVTMILISCYHYLFKIVPLHRDVSCIDRLLFICSSIKLFLVFFITNNAAMITVIYVCCVHKTIVSLGWKLQDFRTYTCSNYHIMINGPLLINFIQSQKKSLIYIRSVTFFSERIFIKI